MSKFICLVVENENFTFYEKTPFIHKHFEKQVEIKGNEIVLVANDESLTCIQLNEMETLISNAIIKKA